MANDEFVDLDDIVPGTGFRKRTDEQAPKETAKTEPEKAPTSPEPKSKPEKPSAQKIIDSSEEAIEEETIDLKPEKKSEKVEKTELKKEKQPEKKEVKEAKETKEPKEIKTPQKVEIKKKTVKQDKPEIKEKPKPLPLKQAIVKKEKAKEDKKEDKKEDRKQKTSKKQQLSKSSRQFGKPNGKETNWSLIALLILAGIVLAVIIYMIFKVDFTGSKNDSVVAVVNGQPIYKSELSNRLNLLRSTMNPLIEEQQVLNLTITDELLLQEASRKGIRTSDEEVKGLLEQIMLANNIDEESLKKDLADKNVSYEFLFNVYRNTLTINKLINESFSNVSVSQEELQAFYDSNLESLKVPDMVQVRHILFMFGTDAESDVYDEATDVLLQIKSDKSNFCNLVTANTDDKESIPACGEYNFSADYMFVPEFKTAGFEMAPGEVKIIKTQIGYHIIYKVANLPGYVPELSEIQDKLIPIIQEEKAFTGLQNLISTLTDNAIIEIYNENISTKRFKEITADEPAVEEQTKPADTEVSIIEPNTDNVETPAEEELSTPQEPAVIPEDVQITKEIVSTPSSEKFRLATCLADNGYRMFTASWSPDSKAQLEMFEEHASNLVLVECDPDSQNANLEECSNVLRKQYPTWPTWQINGNLYEGIQSLTTLSKLSSCPYNP